MCCLLASEKVAKSGKVGQRNPVHQSSATNPKRRQVLIIFDSSNSFDDIVFGYLGFFYEFDDLGLNVINDILFNYLKQLEKNISMAAATVAWGRGG